MEAMQQYEEGNYEEAVNLAYPVRYNIPKLGGSDAQVYNKGKKHEINFIF